MNRSDVRYSLGRWALGKSPHTPLVPNPNAWDVGALGNSVGPHRSPTLPNGHGLKDDRAALACTRKPMGSIRSRSFANRWRARVESVAHWPLATEANALTHDSAYSCNATLSFGWLVSPEPQKCRISASYRRVTGGDFGQA